MCDAGEIHQREYETMRQEINTHTTFGNAAVGLELTALGVGLASSARYSYVTVGLALVTAILWLIYLDHLTGIFRAAAYIVLVLKPRLTEVAGESVLSWEAFLRRQQDGRSATSSPLPVLPRERVREPRLGLTYMSIFFGVTPLVLLAVFLFSAARSGFHDSFYVWVGLVVTFLAWLYAITRFLSVSKWITAVDEMMGAGQLTTAETE